MTTSSNDKLADRMEALLTLEREVTAELYKQASDEREKGHHKNFPITDGVVDEARFLACSPKMLWILKEPWEVGIEETGGGDWSLTKAMIPEKVREKKIGDRGLFANMAWVTYAVLNGFPVWQDLDWISKNPAVGESRLNIAYINISKYPGQKVSNWPFLKKCYARNRDILFRQINTIAPDIIIGGGTLHAFLPDLNLTLSDFKTVKSVRVCYRGDRLYVMALHPAQRSGSEWYVDDIVAAIKPSRESWQTAING